MNKKWIQSSLSFAVMSKKQINAQAEEQILAEKENLKLKTIVVTSAGGYEQNIADAAATISVISKEELEKKSYSDVTDALKNALRCKICNARIHTNSITIDHITRKEDGGIGNFENAQLAHPYCNTTYKN